MSNQNSTRIWENNESSASPPNSTPSRPAQLPSGENPASPAFSNNRSSDQWATPPQSTRELDLIPDRGTTDAFKQDPQHIPRGRMATIIPPRSAHPTEPPIRANSELHPIRQDSRTIHKHLQDLLLPNIAWAFRRSTSNTKILLHINSVASPPYQGANQSQSSIAASLQRERGIPHANGVRHSGTSSIQQPMSPLAPYPGESRQAFSSRTAPIISANPRKEVYSAEKPTAGQPYAFPDPDFSNRSSGSGEANGSAMMSRRNSDHTSITSSIVTSDSRLPVGQHRLDEGTLGFSIPVDHTLTSRCCRYAGHTPSLSPAQAS